MENKAKKLIYFHQGDHVRFKFPVPNAPKVMMVDKIAKIIYKGKDEDKRDKVLLGVDVVWFDTTQALQKARVSTKDIELVDKETYD